MPAQQTITRKSDLEPILTDAQAHYAANGSAALASWLLAHLLCHRVKFPLLEYTAVQINKFIPRQEQSAFIATLFGQPEHGSSVIIGKLLQLWLPDDLPGAFTQACQAITSGNTWYHCDHIGERVFGHGLLTQPDAALPLLTTYLANGDEWNQRAVGVAAHYATKKGLSAEWVTAVLILLLTKANSKAYEVQRGIGWGLKTIAKFHPNMVQAKLAKLPPDAIATPIRRKIETGLAAAAKRKAYS